MFASFLLALREGIEAALIIGIVLGVLKKTANHNLNKRIWLGTGVGVVLSAFTAFILVRIGASFEGKTEEIFEGFMMLIAAGVLTWMIFWMRTRARDLSKEIQADIETAVQKKEGQALFFLALTAILREGIELALFLTSVSFSVSGINVLIGAIAGLLLAVLLAWFLNRSLINLKMRHLFTVTSVLLILFASGLVAHGIHELNEAGWIPPIIEQIWDINHVIDENSTFGEFLKSLFGYNGNPSLTEIIAYSLYFVFILAATLIQKRSQKHTHISTV